MDSIQTSEGRPRRFCEPTLMNSTSGVIAILIVAAILFGLMMPAIQISRPEDNTTCIATARLLVCSTAADGPQSAKGMA
jgi:hypothetical protein